MTTEEEQKARLAKPIKETGDQFAKGLEADKAERAGKNPGPPAPGEYIEDVHPDRMDD